MVEFPTNLIPESGFFTLLDFSKLKGKKYNGNVIRNDNDLFKFLFNEARTKVITGNAIMWPYNELIIRITFSIDDKKIVSALLLIKKALEQFIEK